MSQGVKRRRSSRISGTGYYAKRNKSPAPPTNILSLEHYQQMAEYVRDKTGLSPEVGVVCGSGLGGLSDLVQDPTVSYTAFLFLALSQIYLHGRRHLLRQWVSLFSL